MRVGAKQCSAELAEKLARRRTLPGWAQCESVPADAHVDASASSKTERVATKTEVIAGEGEVVAEPGAASGAQPHPASAAGPTPVRLSNLEQAQLQVVLRASRWEAEPQRAPQGAERHTPEGDAGVGLLPASPDQMQALRRTGFRSEDLGTPEEAGLPPPASPSLSPPLRLMPGRRLYYAVSSADFAEVFDSSAFLNAMPADRSFCYQRFSNREEAEEWLRETRGRSCSEGVALPSSGGDAGVDLLPASPDIGIPEEEGLPPPPPPSRPPPAPPMSARRSYHAVFAADFAKAFDSPEFLDTIPGHLRYQYQRFNNLEEAEEWLRLRAARGDARETGARGEGAART